MLLKYVNVISSKTLLEFDEKLKGLQFRLCVGMDDGHPFPQIFKSVWIWFRPPKTVEEEGGAGHRVS